MKEKRICSLNFVKKRKKKLPIRKKERNVAGEFSKNKPPDTVDGIRRFLDLK